MVNGAPSVSASAAPTGNAIASVARPDVDTTAARILKEYKANEVRADGIYSGKLVRIAGTVDEVKKDAAGDMYVTIGTGATFEIPQAQCFFDDKFARTLAALSHGQKLTVDCTGHGMMMNVLMKDCVVVDPEKTASMMACRKLEGAKVATSCLADPGNGIERVTFYIAGIPHASESNGSTTWTGGRNGAVSAPTGGSMSAAAARLAKPGSQSTMVSVEAGIVVVLPASVPANVTSSMESAVKSL